jgi:O-antigen ligase
VIFAIWFPILLSIAIFPQRKSIKLLAIIFSSICGSLLVLSASGGGWIAAAVGTVVVLAQRNLKALMRTALSVGLIALITIPFWYGAKWIGEVMPFQNLLARISFWEATIPAIKDNPVLGLGIGGWWVHVHNEALPSGPHNTILQLYSDCGILGLVALIIGTLVVLRLIGQILNAAKTYQQYFVVAGVISTLIVTGLLACIESLFVIIVSIGDTLKCVTLPWVWVLMSALVIIHKKVYCINRVNMQ